MFFYGNDGMYLSTDKGMTYSQVYSGIYDILDLCEQPGGYD